MSRSHSNIFGVPESSVALTLGLLLFCLASGAAFADGMPPDLGQSLPTFHCTDNPKIEGCNDDQTTALTQAIRSIFNSGFIWAFACAVTVVSALLLSVVQQIRSIPDPGERRNKWLELTLLVLKIVIGAIVTLLVAAAGFYLKSIGG